MGISRALLGRQKDKGFPSMRSFRWTAVASDLVRLCGKNQVVLGQATDSEKIQTISTTVSFGKKVCRELFDKFDFCGQLVRLLGKFLSASRLSSVQARLSRNRRVIKARLIENRASQRSHYLGLIPTGSNNSIRIKSTLYGPSDLCKHRR